ncbi:O-antigen ligase family protein [Candidatus Gracilibacteria bacterium]|nr:O-antigen ligase family protein [Candidatus Gracilibacteria bacterium]
MGRIPILLEQGVSLVDISVVLLAFFGGIKYFFKEKNFFIYPGFWLFSLFLLVGFSSLLINSHEMVLNFGEFSQSFLYFVRYLLFGTLIFLSFNFGKNFGDDEKKSEENKNFLINGIFISSFIIFILGTLQMKFFGNFEKLGMQNLGWDPHIGRMLSTWFDPNFLSGYFAFVISLAVGVAWEQYFKFKKINYFLIFLIFCLISGIIFSYSRSGLLAFLVASGILGIFLSRKFLLIFTIIFILGIGVSDRAKERFFDGVESAKNIFFNTGTLDPTAKLRVKSWETGIQLFQEKPWLGRGFNTLKIVQKEKWVFMTKSHGASGIDASFLTVLATTGLVGFLLFLGFILWILFFNFKKFLQKKDGFAIGLFAGLLGILANAIFVNILFFYLFLPILFIAIGLGFLG